MFTRVDTGDTDLIENVKKSDGGKTEKTIINTAMKSNGYCGPNRMLTAKLSILSEHFKIFELDTREFPLA